MRTAHVFVDKQYSTCITTRSACTTHEVASTMRGLRLYQLIRQSTPIVDRSFEIEFLDANVEAFSFTFG